MWQFVVYLSPTSQEIQLFMYNTEFEVQPARNVLGSSISADTLVIVYPGKKRSYRASVSKLVPCEDVDTFLKGHAWLPPQLGKFPVIPLRGVTWLYKWQSTGRSSTNPVTSSALIPFLSFTVIPGLVEGLAYKQNTWC